MAECYYKGDDIKFNFKLKDENGVYLDLTLYKYIHARVKIANTTSIVKFSTDPTLWTGGYEELYLSDPTTLLIIIDSSITIGMSPGYATIGVNLVTEDTDLTDTNFNKNIEIKRIFKLEDSDTKIGEES